METAETFPRPVEPATLYLVSTPIGNLGDMTPRALEVLRAADMILCEDTRVTGKLLAAFQIEGSRLASYRDETEKRDAPRWLNELKSGKSLALVADAGTPTLSDPGFRLVRLCRKEGVTVIPIPGVSAAITALSASGLPSDAFFFAGFLAPKTAARRRFFEDHKDFPHTIIVYESVHRIGKCLDDMLAVFGTERIVCVARELTKKFETILSGPLGNVRDETARRSQKGEFVILIAKDGFEL
ncbi:MAG: 16S rRNA (cytidine(1402)-2'-O)-methyltransferase [Verrucomicrobiota bacterium]